ncbi:MAG: PQQ-dependent sugar dehydrogenase [Proteobacteria bacterium]|nr:PQQ-dependent sugar dehydrogenase [Pseudomonadota bacterium]
MAKSQRPHRATPLAAALAAALAVALAIAVVVATGPLSGALGASDGRIFESERHRFRLTVVASGLEHPWGLAFLPDGAMLVTERPGRLRVIRDGVLDPTPVSGVPEVAAVGQGGLLDVALHPRFRDNRLVYLSYAGKGRGGAGTEVARGRLSEGRLEDLEILFAVRPKSRGGRHFGSRLVFDAQGRLYITAGERGDPDRAQDPGDAAGSVIRLTEDGGIPPDNPFVGRAGARPEIFSIGHRNPQGLARHPETGRIWAVEHGPRGGDEVNVIEAGVNYGWPVITSGMSYAGFPIGEGSEKPGMAQPVTYWVPSISPSGMAFYTGAAFPAWRGNLFVGALSGRLLVRLELDGERVVHEERLLEELGERIRDVRQGPDGLLYLLTDAPDGALLRLEPLP